MVVNINCIPSSVPSESFDELPGHAISPKGNIQSEALIAINSLSELHKLSVFKGAGITGLEGMTTLAKSKTRKAWVNGVPVQFITRRDYKHIMRGRKILVVYPSPDFLNLLTRMQDLKTMLVVPWFFEDISAWITQTNAKELTS